MNKEHDKGHKGQMSDREAMKLALEALLIWEEMHPRTTASAVRSPAIQALQEALEQPDDAAWAKHLKEPMSEKRVHESDTIVPSDYSGKAGDHTEQEPVAWVLHRELFWPYEYEVISENGDNAIPLYTTPPKREWVGLTNEEIDYLDMETSGTVHDFVHAIEAKLKEKNHA